MAKKKTPCSPEEISLKSYFLGPQAENAKDFHQHLSRITKSYFSWRKSQFPHDGKSISLSDRKSRSFTESQKLLATELEQLIQEYHEEIPIFSPRYIGHMLSDLSLPGLLGHWLTALHNPNNISAEVSPVGIRVENQAIEFLANMVGWKKAKGHFTSGGTIANIEALLRMRHTFLARPAHLRRGRGTLLVSAAAHYSWKKALAIAGYAESAYCEIPLNKQGRIDTDFVARLLQKKNRQIMGIVTLFGSTEMGTIDDISKVNQLLLSSPTPIWHHVDGAYGAFFATVKNRATFSYLSRQTVALKKVHSMTLDPHKLGYVPYGCGAFICRRPTDYFYQDIHAPYLDFKSKNVAGVQTIEGSRPATGATATYLTAKTLGFHHHGFGRLMERQLHAADHLREKMGKKIQGVYFPAGLDLNILCWSILNNQTSLSQANSLTQKIYETLPLMDHGYFVAKTSLEINKHPDVLKNLVERKIITDVPEITLIRMTLMNPFFINKESKIFFADEFISQVLKILKTDEERPALPPF